MIDATPYTVELEQLEPPIAWSAVFGNDRPVELEIGSGKGLFLANAGSPAPTATSSGSSWPGSTPAAPPSAWPSGRWATSGSCPATPSCS